MINSNLYNNSQNKINSDMNSATKTEQKPPTYINSSNYNPEEAKTNLADRTITKLKTKKERIIAILFSAIKLILKIVFFPVTIIVFLISELIKANSVENKNLINNHHKKQHIFDGSINTEHKNDIKEEQPRSTKKKANAVENKNLINNHHKKQHIFDGSINTEHKKDTKDKTKITALFNKNDVRNYNPEQLAEEAYGTMFQHHDKLNCIPGIQDTNKTCIEKLNYLSNLFIKDIQENLGPIKKEEQEIIDTILSIPPLTLKFQHQTTNEDLDLCGKLCILSGDRSESSGVARSDSPTRYPNVHNGDFVFFSTDFTGSNITIPPAITSFNLHFYGENAYIIPEGFSDFGYITLQDQLIRHIEPDSNIFRENGMLDIMQLLSEPPTFIKSTKFNTTPIFNLKDTRLGMALYIINRIRALDQMIDVDKDKNNLLQQRKKFMGYLLTKDSSCQNQVLNSILSVEYHLPGMVIAHPGEYAKHKCKK